MTAGAEAVFAMGAAALEANDFRAAEQFFHQIVQANPRAHPAWNALSVVAVRSGLPEVATEHAKRALELDRRNPIYLNSLGVAQGELGLFADAAESFRRALKAKPVYAEAMFNLGKVLHKQNELKESVRAFERAFVMDPRFPGLLAALIAVYRKDGRADRALAVLNEGAASVTAEELDFLRAACMSELEGPDRTIAWLREQLSEHPQRHKLRFSLAQLLLLEGEWREGWQAYLWRPNLLSERVDASGGTHLPSPLPHRLDGKNVLLHGEQGIGDVLFFLRFVPMLRERGARITLTYERKIAGFIAAEGPLDAVRESATDASLQFDCKIWCGDLPALLAVDNVAAAWRLPLDNADTARARARLAALGPGPYLGVTWRAGTDTLRRREFGNERNLLMKQVPPHELGAAVRGWPGTVIGLQRGMHPEEAVAFTRAANGPLQDLSNVAEDLNEVLPLLSALDDYVCVSNTNVHLLAGIGRTARVLVPYPPEWRWMREGESQWFPAFKTYREPQSRGWEKPLLDLRRDLSL